MQDVELGWLYEEYPAAPAYRQRWTYFWPSAAAGCQL